MNGPIIQILVLAGIAIFLILRLRGVLGTREGFEKPPVPQQKADAEVPRRRDFEVIEGGPDRDIVDHADEGTSTAMALTEMKKLDPSFNVGEFLSGARQAYEMILMAFERGDMTEVRPFVSDDIDAAFTSVIDDRAARGLTVEATFIGVSEVTLKDASLDPNTKEAEITVRFTGELTHAVYDADGKLVDGDPNGIKKQKDIWTFARDMDSGDPNWRLVATE
ncbi:Tim44 domain-containing protein [Salipiger sp. IMCC34102]|uniref:Tim44/TimA family putative adaptor protein n=1 Tax=Salipiger sp. IMCC34102 TaxID=2510647 RepID=UPI00101CCFBD|nr:Tim44/TimA family putative adaptor protein [Salipiger sp. IMCC34102]RYH04224.1 Tim44 domain-containing protein [Salipiger sp. IMCC34102]